MRAKARTNVRARAGARPATPVAKERTPAKARVGAQPMEVSRLKYYNQAITACLLEQRL
jgi:hypothetical protein